ncbi:putative WD repeat-containing protein 11 [Apostichopus japonicus]|uniref:Putative WD repeat-containing protein 11 n=1 Tax=Stichopus japonicus TaxID=307972 RepID=A0A2G8JBZ1_STIJA|nr:putative WD repeat-containing protein 11 [Apostichopus japonicus]
MAINTRCISRSPPGTPSSLLGGPMECGHRHKTLEEIIHRLSTSACFRSIRAFQLDIARPRLPHFHQRLQPVKAAIQQWQEILHYNVNSTGDTSTTTAEKKQNIGGARTAFKRVRMIVGDSKPGNSNSQPEEQDTSLQECIQFCYLKSQRHHLVLVYAREILVLDLEIRQTVTTIPMDRSGSPFINIHPLRHRDMLMCLHENGTISVRMYKKTGTIQAGDAIPSDMEISYDLKCQSDPLRVTKHMKTFGFSVSPVTSRRQPF